MWASINDIGNQKRIAFSDLNSIAPARSSRRNPSPLQRHVIDSLRGRIQSGAYRSGARLPSERELTEDFGVHRNLVRTAIVHLVQEGLLIRQAHCRPIVQGGPASEAEVPKNVSPTLAESRLVALSMWRGAGGASGSAQQRIFWGLNQALGQAGYHCVLLDLGGSNGSERQTAEREAMHLRYALDSAFAGMIFYAYAYHDNCELIQEVARRMPTVLIDRMVAGVDVDFVGSQNRKAMFDATNYLIEQGHRRIAYLTRTEAINPVQDRLQGYLTAMHGAFGLNAREIVLTAAPSDSDDWFVSDTIFRLPPEERPTAVLCVNDIEAVRLSERLEALGLSIPGDVSVIGFDNIIRALPDGLGLTTVAQSFEEIGKSAAKQFLCRVADPTLPHARIEIPTHLVIRESTSPIGVPQEKRAPGA